MPAPERYDGDLGLCRSFLLQCSLVFELQPQTYPTHKSRIAYLIGSMRGEALAWAAAVWERGSAVCADYFAFTNDMRKVFDHPVRGREASQRLLWLCQGSRSVASFAVEFRTLVAESGWNKEALQGVFLNALGGDIKEELTYLDQLISLAIRVDNRIRERRRKRAQHLFTTSAASCRGSHLRAHADWTHVSLSPSLSLSLSLSLSRGERALRAHPGLSLLCSPGPFPVRMSLSLWKRTGSLVTRGILVSRSCNSSFSPPLLEAVLQWQEQTISLSILLDSEFY